MAIFNKFDTVKLIERTEIKPLFFINDDVTGVVMDKTFPNYFLVKFENLGCYWVDGCKLERVVRRGLI